jgi:hypothetical protein
MKRRFRALAAIAAALTGAAALGGAPAQAETPNNYPLSGFFIYSSKTHQTNVDKLEAMKAVGGDTVITFGSILKPATLNASKQVLKTDGTVDPAYTNCQISGVPCLTSITAGYTINRVFTFSNLSHWGGGSLKCAKDKKVDFNGSTYTILLIPNLENGCYSADNTYDVVAIDGGKTADADPVVSVANAATSLGMKFYAGMPAPIKRTDYAWLPDMSYSATLGKFTERFMMFQSANNNVAGLAGFYHTTEMPLVDSAAWTSVTDLYRIQNAAIEKYLPTREAVISPYLDARFSNTYTPASATNAVKNIAATASGTKLYIAPQDGMGTGKGGAYMGNEATLNVDPFAASIVGPGTWGEKYQAPTSEYYKAAAAGITGTGATLWANIEGMAPEVATNTCGSDSLRGQTTKTRLDRQIQQTGLSVKKNISFMWDPYFTCKVNGTGPTLVENLVANGGDPIINDSAANPATGALTVYGYNLTGSSIKIKYTTPLGQVQERTATVTSHNPSYGQTAANGDVRLESATVNFGAYSLGSGKYYMLYVTNGDGKTNKGFYSKLY